MGGEKMLVKIVGDRVEKVSKEEFIEQIREAFKKKGGFELYSSGLKQYYITSDEMWLVIPEDAKVELVSERDELDIKYYKYRVSNAKYVIVVSSFPKEFRWGIPVRMVTIHGDCEFYEELRALRDELYIP
jgi:phage FluMu gp28-like protein